MKNNKSRRIFRKIKNLILNSLCIGLLLVILLIVGFYIYYEINYKAFVDDVVDNMTYQDFILPSNQTLYFSNGEEMLLYSPYQKEVLSSTSDITEVIKNTALAAEDERFYSHNGIDVKSIARAFLSNLFSSNTQGASTITQQLVKLTYLSNEKTYDRKIKEMFIAMGVEKRLTKDEILLLYLNRVYFYNGVYGIADAAEFYFNKSYKDLTYDEAASLIGIINSPTNLDPITQYSNNQARKNRIIENLNRLFDLNLSTSVSTQFDINDEYNDTYSYDTSTTGAISYVLYDVEENSMQDASSVQTTIDYDLQVYVESLVDELNDPLEAAVVVIDNDSGKVIAIDGSKSSEDGGSIYSLNRAYQSPRQTGSSIKPLLDYSVLFDNYDVDTSFEVYDTGGTGIPSNSNNTHLGKITIKKAVTNSVNTIAFRLYSYMVDDGIVPLGYLEKMNFSYLDDKDYSALAVSIGGFTYGATALEMAGGYATLANSGLYREPTALADVNSEEVRIYSPLAAYLTTDALSDVAKYGTAKKLNPSVPIACKTGTTNDYKDAWLCGYTNQYTIAIWVGADDSTESYSVKSSGEVLTMFKLILEYLDPADEEIYSEAEVASILSHSYTRRDSTGLTEYFQSLMPYSETTDGDDEANLFESGDGSDAILQPSMPDSLNFELSYQLQNDDNDEHEFDD